MSNCRTQNSNASRRMNQSSPAFLGLLIVLAITATTLGLTTLLTGKVVGVSDGDTFTLLTSNREQLKIRLDGIDCPEKSQDFGQVAKQFTSEMVFGKEVRVQVSTKDRYGRFVGTVYIDSACLNEELLKAGLAWWYQKYAAKNARYSGMEAAAKSAKKGLWVRADAIAPWDFRHPKKTEIVSDTSGGDDCLVVINLNTKKFHGMNCRYAQNCGNCEELSKKQALAKGGSPCQICGGHCE